MSYTNGQHGGICHFKNNIRYLYVAFTSTCECLSTQGVCYGIQHSTLCVRQGNQDVRSFRSDLNEEFAHSVFALQQLRLSKTWQMVLSALCC